MSKPVKLSNELHHRLNVACANRDVYLCVAVEQAIDLLLAEWEREDAGVALPAGGRGRRRGGQDEHNEDRMV